MRFKTAIATLLSVLCLQASANTVVVHIFNFDFGSVPPTHSDPVIEAGDTVRWILDTGVHSSKSAAGQAESWDSTIMTVGGSTYDHTFTNVGTFNYFCQLHGFDLGGGQVGGMSGKVIVANTYHPTAFTLFRGKLVSGGVPELQNSDDQYLIVGRGLVANIQEATIQVDFTTTVPTMNPSVLAVSLEDGSNAAGLTRRIFVLNVQTNQLEQVNQSSLTIADKLTVVQLTGDLSRFVNQTTGVVKVRVAYPQLGPVSIFGYQAKFDRLAILSD